MTTRKYPTTPSIKDAVGTAYSIEIHYDRASGITTAELCRHIVGERDGRKVWSFDRVISEGTCLGNDDTTAIRRMREGRWQIRDLSRSFMKVVAS